MTEPAARTTEIAPSHRQRRLRIAAIIANLVGSVTGCADPDTDPEGPCPRVAHSDGAAIVLDRYLAVRGHADALITFCIDGARCGSAEVHLGDDPTAVDCRTTAGTRLWCAVDDAGALQVGLELDRLEPMTQRRRYDVLLSQDGVDAEASGTMVLEAQVPYGEHCGVTHVEGEIRLDASTLQPIEPG